jgi:predicted transcriptional regulator
MNTILSSLEGKREQLYRQLQETGDFRRGTISVLYRKCGKKNCVCAKEGHPGHGPRYLWNATIGGKSYAKNLKLDSDMEKYQEEIANHQRFQKLCAEIVEVNEQICEMRPIRVIEDDDDLAALKKKLQQTFIGKYKRK